MTARLRITGQHLVICVRPISQTVLLDISCLLNQLQAFGMISENTAEAEAPRKTPPATESKPLKPFIKWAGGKTDLLPELLSAIPPTFNTYFEPFLGGASLFFGLPTRPQQSHLSDISAELINCYTVVRDQLPELLISLSTHQHDEAYFYQLRQMDRTPDFQNLSTVERASRFIFLNKTCYNGLYRVNSKGQFNVPFGKYENPRVFTVENLTHCAQALQNTEIACCSFDAILQKVQAGDLVYCDPPYDPVSKTSSFTAYDKEGFARKMQTNLRDFCGELDSRGVQFIVSNSYTTLTLDLYRKFTIRIVKTRRAINSKAEGRGKIAEIIVTNYDKPQKKLRRN